MVHKDKKIKLFFEKYGFDLSPEEFEKLFTQEYSEDWEKLWHRYKVNLKKEPKKRKPLNHPKQVIGNIYNVRMKKHKQELYEQKQRD